VGRQLLHSFPITLHGLLDYDDSDVEEELLELGLFAEGFHEMLMCDYATSIYNFLLKDRCEERGVAYGSVAAFLNDCAVPTPLCFKQGNSFRA
jgi:hypothetical protein